MNRETLCGRLEKDPNALSRIVDNCADLGVSRLGILNRISADRRVVEPGEDVSYPRCVLALKVGNVGAELLSTAPQSPLGVLNLIC